MIVKRHNYTLKNTGSIEPVSVQCRRTKNQHRSSTCISIKHERFDQRCRNVVPASSTLSKPCPSIGPNLRAWWVPRKHDTSTQCWSSVGQRLLAQHWPSTGPMYRVYRVLYHVWNRRIYYSVHKQRPTVRHDIEVKCITQVTWKTCQQGRDIKHNAGPALGQHRR